MALSNLIVKISADTKEFVVGTTRVKRDAEGLKSGMKMLSQAITEGSVRLKEMAAAGQGASNEYKELKTQVAQARSALRGMGGELSTLKKTADSGFGGRQIADALTGGLIGGGVAGLAMGIAGGVRDAFKGAIKDASDLSETMAKTGVIFGDAQAAVQVFAEGAAQAIGQSKQQAMDAAATFGVFGKAAGLTGNELASFSVDLVKLSSDMASFSNTTPEQAITAIGAALRGESEPIRQYGVLLNDAAMRQKAMELGIYDGNGALDAQQKILAAQALIFEQTADAQGDFARTSDGLANQQRILNAELTDLSAQLGQALVPAANAGIKGLLGLINATKALTGFVAENSVAIGSLIAAYVIYNSQLIASKVATVATAIAEKGAAAVKWLLTTAQTALNAAMTANPIGAVIKGISLLVAGIGIAYNSSEKFRAVIAGIGATAMEMFKIVKETIGQFVEGFKMLLSGDIMGGLKNIAGAIVKGNPIGLAMTEGKRLAGAFSKGYNDKLKSEKTQATQGGAAIAAATADGIVGGTEKVKAAAGKVATAAVKEIKTAADVFGGVIANVSMTEEYYALIGDELGLLQAKHRELESGMKQAWEAGGYASANYVMELKRQRDEVSKSMETIKEMQKGISIAPTIATGGQRMQQSSGGLQIPGVDAAKTLAPLLASFHKEMQNANLLQAAFGDVDMIASEMSSLGQLISEGLEAGLDQSSLQSYIDRWKELNAEQAKQAEFANVMSEVGDAAFNAFQSVGSGAMSASEGVKAFGLAAVNASLDAARGALVEAIMNNAKFLTKTLGPLGIPIALAGAGALFGVLKGAIGRSKAVAFADGGIVSGPVMGLVGEYAGASRNPEVIAPLDKLQSMLQGSGSTHVTGTFRVQGSDLVLALDNAQRKMSQFRV